MTEQQIRPVATNLIDEEAMMARHAAEAERLRKRREIFVNMAAQAVINAAEAEGVHPDEIEVRDEKGELPAEDLEAEIRARAAELLN